MGSGGGTDVQYEQSPEARQAMQSLLPMLQGFGQYGTQRYFGGAPQMGAPSMAGVLSSQPMYNIPGLNQPQGSQVMGQPSAPLPGGNQPVEGGIQMGQGPTGFDRLGGQTSPQGSQLPLPTADWYGSLAPEVKAGLYAPYAEAGRGLMEAMGSRGQLGNARAGLSGATGAAMGELAGQAAKNVGLNAWQMTAPGLSAAWQAELQRNMNQYNVGQQERLADYNTAMNVWGLPMQAMGMTNQFMPQGVVTQNQSPIGGMLGGGITGGLAGNMMFPGIGGIAGAGLGALGGLFS